MRRVFVEFAKHAFGGDHSPGTNGAASHGGKGKMVQAHTAQMKPFYDQLYDVINEEIAKLKLPKPKLVSWVKEIDFKKAVMETANIPDISSIEDRFEKTDAKYPKVHFDHFD